MLRLNYQLEALYHAMAEAEFQKRGQFYRRLKDNTILKLEEEEEEVWEVLGNVAI